MYSKRLILSSLLSLLAGCSSQPSTPPDIPTGQAYCLRSGETQLYDCSAPALAINLVRDPLAPGEEISDEDLMALLAEIRRWLEWRRLTLLGEPIPPELIPPEERPPALSEPALANPNQPLWPRVIDSISRPSLQRSIP